jgi:hypothetical protein
LYKFKSRNTGDVIMLEPDGRRLLEIIGEQPGPKGIIQPTQMAAAVVAIEAAIRAEELGNKEAGILPGEDPGLRQRSMPFIDMLRRNLKSGDYVVWGV